MNDVFSADPVSISIEHVCKVFKTLTKPKIAFNNFSLRIYSNQCFGLLGPNGAGKTTLISLMCGLTPCEKGSIIVDGLSVANQLSKVYQKIGVCPQDDRLFDLLTGNEHIELYSHFKEQRLDKEQIQSIANSLGLSTHLPKLTKNYSGGNKRKLCLLLALLGDPSIVFLDEPSSGMDPKSRRQMWRVLDNFKRGKTLILTTHSMEEAGRSLY